jgi:hypothetical protein
VKPNTAVICQAAIQQVSFGPVFSFRVPAETRNSLTHDVVQSFLRHRHELPALPMGSNTRDYKAAKEARRQAAYQIVAAEVAERRGIDISKYCRNDQRGTNKRYIMEIALLAVLAFFLSPGFVLLCICGAMIGWLVESELNRQIDENTFEAAAAECRAEEMATTMVSELSKPRKRP